MWPAFTFDSYSSGCDKLVMQPENMGAKEEIPKGEGRSLDGGGGTGVG